MCALKVCPVVLRGVTNSAGTEYFMQRVSIFHIEQISIKASLITHKTNKTEGDNFGALNY